MRVKIAQVFLALFALSGVYAASAETIDFESISPGDIVDDVFSDADSGPIGVMATNPGLDARFTGPNNAAVVFDSANPPAHDVDLGTPNENFGGPGVGVGGESGAFVNNVPLGNILIVNEQRAFVDRDNDQRITAADSPVTRIDDADLTNESITFDFTLIGPVTVESVTILDVEPDEEAPATVELLDVNGNSLDMFTVAQPGDNGVARDVSLGPTSGVYKMIVILNGSGAVDDIVFNRALAALGDRVWLDTDRDGLQDCSDTNNNGIIGDAGDMGVPGDDECSNGVENVKVTLGNFTSQGCELPADAPMRVTDASGFYLFDDLAAGDYCVLFSDLPDDTNCTLFDAGGDDAVDSDGEVLVEGASCLTRIISLAEGETNLTVDLGLVEPAATVSIGDRIWKDVDGDGVQDCSDTNNDGILGNAGDTGSECGEGIDGVPVMLLMPDNGSCDTATSVLGEVTTMNGGFYLFDGLDPAVNYCVMFGAPPEPFCIDPETGIDLGAPLFTLRNEGSDDAADSDANPMNGKSEIIDLSSGMDDLSIDAGIVCPVKIGNRVWEDDGDGIQEAGEDDIGGVTVKLFDCGPDMIAGTSDDVDTGQMQTTDDQGMYMFGGADPGPSLQPNKYYVLFDPATYPPGYAPGPAGVGPDSLDSDCKPPSGITECTDLRASGSVNLDRDCGLVPPPPDCQLTLDKSCRIEAPPPQDFNKCDGKLQQFTLRWEGAGPITASGPNNTESLANGDEATFFGPFSQNDVIVDISGAVNGQSKFHTSCSDEDFNDPSDCGKLAGDGKSNESGLINDWRLEGFIDDSGQVLDCSPSGDGDFADNCSFAQPLPPSCETTGKPDNLTWRYDGGMCDGTFDIQKDFECTGTVDETLAIVVMDDDGNSYSVEPGAEFTTPLDASKELTLSNSGGTQDLVLHTSCSQPIEAGLTAGALTLVALDGLTGGADVTYRYLVTNDGDPLTGVTVTDDLLGSIGGPVPLGTGGSAMFDMTTRLFGTTVNVGTATGFLSNGMSCSPGTASDTVTVEVVEPTCQVSITLDKVEDKKIKWKLSNSSGVDAIIDNLTISWPGSENLKKIKFDGDDILKDVALSSPATINDGDWRSGEDRTLDAGDSGKKLEFEFTGNFPQKKEQPASDFDLTVNFAEGCSVTL